MFESATSKELQDRYGLKTTKQVNRWVEAIEKVFPSETLKIGSNNRTRYTPFCVQKIDEIAKYYEQSKTVGDWVNDQLVIQESLKKTADVQAHIPEIVPDEHGGQIAPITHQDMPVVSRLNLPAIPETTYNTQQIGAANVQNIEQLNGWINQTGNTLIGNVQNMGAVVGATALNAFLNGMSQQLAPIAHLLQNPAQTNQQTNQEQQ